MDVLNEKEFFCPYCGSCNTITLEPGQGKEYELITDCEICCRPIVVSIKMIGEEAEITARAENE
ncbi:MAG: CPXCG motif-containing cysteine-rich protein [Candidatus Omnitrophota bacterium]